MAKRPDARPRPPRASVPAFGGWELGGAAADYSLDFTNIRAARMMQRRTKALSWSSFVVGNAAAVAAAEGEALGGGGDKDERRPSAATSDGDDDDVDGRERRRRRRHQRRHSRHRRLRSDDVDVDGGADGDRRQPIQPRRAAPEGRRSKVKGYLFGCVGGQW